MIVVIVLSELSLLLAVTISHKLTEPPFLGHTGQLNNCCKPDTQVLLSHGDPLNRTGTPVADLAVHPVGLRSGPPPIKGG